MRFACCKPVKASTLVLGAAFLFGVASPLAGQEAAPGASETSPMVALDKASVEGKYAKLLRQIEVEDDAALYGEFYDWGYYTGASYRGFDDLPAGYWVWVKPHWYIWGESKGVAAPAVLEEFPPLVAAKAFLEIEARGEPPKEEPILPVVEPPAAPAAPAVPMALIPLFEAAPVKAAGRSWGPEQATGPPDTPAAGDYSTAWASKTPDGADEWLELSYEKPVELKKVLVHETYNPGALIKVVAYTSGEMDTEIWSGRDPVVDEGGKGVAEIPVDARITTQKIRIYLDSKAVAGWNEIDAVGLVDAKGVTHWATKAVASSTFADRGGPEAGGGLAVGGLDGGGLIVDGGIGGGIAVDLGGDAAGPVVIRVAPADPFGPAPPLPGGPGADAQEARIRELEATVRELQKQVEELRRRVESERK